MKKKLLLAFLPVALILSGCSGLSKNVNKVLLIEDTLAHEEIFGEFSEIDLNMQSTNTLLPKKALAPGELYTPVLGFQKVHDDVNHVYNIRYVAAIEDNIESATWTRSVSNIAGTVVSKKARADKVVDHVYSTLSDNGAHTPATGVKAKEDSEVSPFSYFAVYCLLNIPDSYEDYYVHAFITVSDGTNSKKSSVGAMKIKTGEHTEYAYVDESAGRDVAFVNGQVVESVAHNDDKVSLLSYHLSAGDKIEIVYIDLANLKFVKNSSLAMGDGRVFPDFSLDQETDVLSTTYSGTYNVFLNGSNKFYFEKKIYFQAPGGWGSDYSSKMQLKNNDESDHPQVSMNVVSGTLFYYFVDTSLYQDAQFFQEKNGDKKDWTAFRGGSPLKNGKDLFSVDDWSHLTTTGSWSSFDA